MISVLIYSLNYIDALFHAKIITRILSTNNYQCHCSNHLVGIPSVPLGGKVVGPRQTLQVVGQLYRFAVYKHKKEEEVKDDYKNKDSRLFWHVRAIHLQL